MRLATSALRAVTITAVLASFGLAPAFALTELTSCGTLSNSGETYRLAANLTASGTCLVIDGSNITLDGNGKTLTYSTGANGNAILINAQGAEVYNLTIVKGPFDVTGDATSSSNPNGHALFANQADARIHHVTFNITNNAPNNVKALLLKGAGTNVDIHDNVFNLDGTTTASAMEFRSGDKAGAVYDNTSNIGGTLAFNDAVRSVHVYVGSQHTSQRLRFTGNTFTSGPGTVDIQHFQVWESQNIDINENRLTDNGAHYRMVLLDGCVDCRVFDNTMTMNGSGGPAAGIRLRHSASGNEIYGNTIDASGCSGDCHTVTLGAGTNTRVHHNSFLGREPSGAIFYFDEGNFSGYHLYNNTYTITGGSNTAIKFLMWQDRANDISLSHETIINNGSGPQVIRFQDSGADGPYDVVLCNVTVDGAPLTAAQVADAGGANEWTINNTPCAGGCCYGGATLPTCGDGRDNDHDGFCDAAGATCVDGSTPGDPGCSGADDASERQAGGPACDDGADNDGDQLTDYPTEPGCSGPADGDENNCGDGVRNGNEVCDQLDVAGQNCANHGFDGGSLRCLVDCSAFDLGLCTMIPDCSDGQDNDGDGVSDHPADPGCADPSDETEKSAALVCDDGVDNDGDGLVDSGASGHDPGCAAPADESENNCGNGAIDGNEQCDGELLGGATCQGEGFDAGSVSCGENCALDLGDCSRFCATWTDKSAWSIAYVDSEDLGTYPTPASNAIDGNPQTQWHVEWEQAQPPYPHEIWIDLGQELQICGFSYTPRTTVPYESGVVAQYAFFASNVPNPTIPAPGVPLDEGQWTPLSSSTTKGPLFDGSYSPPPVSGPVDRYFQAVRTRFIRLRPLSEVNGHASWCGAAEIGLSVGFWPEMSAPPNLRRADTRPTQ